ncbi:hypothetical protein LINGRAHAP2_LOCUS5279 [Linum grandiflorum]
MLNQSVVISLGCRCSWGGSYSSTSRGRTSPSKDCPCRTARPISRPASVQRIGEKTARKENTAVWRVYHTYVLRVGKQV